jgi:hypothetical protein
MQVGSNAPDFTAERSWPRGQARRAPASGVSCPYLGSVRTQVEPLSLSQEAGMFELNFSSNADWIVAVLLVVTVVAAVLV